jgi:ABC-2 type transport system ATP-binding protein
VGLKGKEKIKLQKYSKGMIQRIGIAQAIVNDPSIVILDEPFSGLDPVGRKELRDLILGLRNEGKTILFSSHILHDIETLVDRVGIIFNGVTIREGKISELVQRTIHSYEILFTLPPKVSPEELNPEIQPKDKKLFINISHNKKDRFISQVVASGGKVISVSPNRMTLENIFLKEISK